MLLLKLDKSLAPGASTQDSSRLASSSPSVSLCLPSRSPSTGFSGITRAGFGCPTRSRAFARTALAALKVSFFFFGTDAILPGLRILS